MAWQDEDEGGKNFRQKPITFGEALILRKTSFTASPAVKPKGGRSADPLARSGRLSGTILSKTLKPPRSGRLYRRRIKQTRLKTDGREPSSRNNGTLSRGRFTSETKIPAGHHERRTIVHVVDFREQGLQPLFY